MFRLLLSTFHKDYPISLSSLLPIACLSARPTLSSSMKSACQDAGSCTIKAFSWQQAHYLLMLHRHSMDSRSSRRSSYRQALDLSQAGQNPRYRQSVDLSPYRHSQHHRQSFDFRPSAAQSFDSSQFRQSSDFLQPLEPYDSLLHRQPTPYRQSMDFTPPGHHSQRYRQSHKQQAPPPKTCTPTPSKQPQPMTTPTPIPTALPF